MIVMLADTAVDSLLTAAQAGSRGYSLLLQSVPKTLLPPLALGPLTLLATRPA